MDRTAAVYDEARSLLTNAEFNPEQPLVIDAIAGALQRRDERIAELEAENRSLGEHLNASVDRVLELERDKQVYADKQQQIFGIVKSMRTKLGALNEQELLESIRALGDE